MWRAGLRSLLFWSVAVLFSGAVAGCDNPFNPLDKTDKIQGLTWFDFSQGQARWDTDPEWDGLEVTLDYHNEFGDGLNFHDKPHKVQIELWSEVDGATATEKVRGSIIYTKTVTFSNSDDIIRIPVESYASALALPSTDDIKGFMLVRIFPPQESPKKELVAPIQKDVVFYKPLDVPVTP